MFCHLSRFFNFSAHTFIAHRQPAKNHVPRLLMVNMHVSVQRLLRYIHVHILNGCAQGMNCEYIHLIAVAYSTLTDQISQVCWESGAIDNSSWRHVWWMKFKGFVYWRCNLWHFACTGQSRLQVSIYVHCSYTRLLQLISLATMTVISLVPRPLPLRRGLVHPICACA